MFSTTYSNYVNLACVCSKEVFLYLWKGTFFKFAFYIKVNLERNSVRELIRESEIDFVQARF